MRNEKITAHPKERERPKERAQHAVPLPGNDSSANKDRTWPIVKWVQRTMADPWRCPGSMEMWYPNFRWLAALCLAFTLVCWPRLSWGFAFKIYKDNQLKIDIASTSVFEYHINNLSIQRPAHGPTYMDLRNKIDLNIEYMEYTIGGRVDTYNFFADRAPCHSSFPNCKGAYYPEKLYLKFRHKQIDFVAGDFYFTLGRGLALAIRKVDEFAIDNTLRGGRITYDDGTIQATVAAGFVNSNNFDPVQETILADTNDLIFASRLAHRFAKKLNLAAHYVHIRLAPQEDLSGSSLPGTSFDAYTHIAGGSLELSQLFRKLDFYFEGNGMVQRFGTKDIVGYAFYSNVTAYLFPVTLLIEGSYYKNYSALAELRTLYLKKKESDLPTIDNLPVINYVNPPTMERDDLDTVGDTSNVRGLRSRIDYTLPNRKTVFHLNYMLRVGFAATQGIPPLTIHHLYGGIEHRDTLFSLHINGGIREGLHTPDWRIAHIDGDLSFHFLQRHSIEFRGIYWWNSKSKHVFHIADLQLGYALSKILSVAFLYSYYDEDQTKGQNHHFAAGEIQFHLFGYGSLKVHYGSTRGGLRCISGVCRIFPPFEGFKTELALRF